ncbi:MAG: ABC transporter ATP-binding protein [Lentisphaerae bacterium]|nr:ABC transporter ATP-binding protein [Lentisphaerota bacterium]
MPDAITVNNLGKKYRLRSSGTPTMKAAVLDLVRGRRRVRRDFWALRDVSFAVRRGETLGIIGFNGAGKSTLLALLAGTKTPTCGSLATEGTISSLLELGAGFHPDLTGRENIFLCGAIMGMSQSRMRERFDAIVSFAGLETFIDQPVKHYSSGMYVRLGFAVAVEVDPDIVLIDEVLAVGDITFQRKCIERMKRFREQGKTMLMISHDLKTIQSISDRILLLNEGRILGLGDPESLVDRYETLSRDRMAQAIRREWGTGGARLTDVRFLDAEGRETDTFRSGSALTARIRYSTDQPVERPVFGFAIADTEGRLVHGSNTQLSGLELPEIRGEGAVTLRVTPLALAAGTYLFSFSLHSWDHKTNYHRLDNVFPVVVESEKAFEGVCYLPSSWDAT